MYHIRYFSGTMGNGINHDFEIDVPPQWQAIVDVAGMTQDQVNRIIEAKARTWLDNNGYDELWGADCPDYLDPKTHLYSYLDIHVGWGMRGIEHIGIPGSGSGLDINTKRPSLFKGGYILSPHNIDTLMQKTLVITIYSDLVSMILSIDKVRKHVF